MFTGHPPKNLPSAHLNCPMHGEVFAAHSPKNLSSRAERSGVEGSAVAFHNCRTPERLPEKLLLPVRPQTNQRMRFRTATAVDECLGLFPIRGAEAGFGHRLRLRACIGIYYTCLRCRRAQRDDYYSLNLNWRGTDYPPPTLGVQPRQFCRLPHHASRAFPSAASLADFVAGFANIYERSDLKFPH